MLLICLLLLLQLASRSQGRVVVNEYMAWSGCNTTSEFIELLNFGPGPMNIGCYVLTNGKYAVTIPPNTVLKPGQYYVLAGQNTLYKNCNTGAAVPVDLNWTTCGCTDKPIPTTGDGFLQDGGNANEKVVLLDAEGGVVDAVTRKTPATASDLLTTAGGTCTPRTFDLDNLSISYESLGLSTGVDNSFARTVDGDCSWEKTTAISPGTANQTGKTSSATYSFSTISASECASTAGRVSISVSAADVASLFPMSYILGYDVDSNGVFDDTDRYTYGVDNTASSIDITNLAYGRYRITVASAQGCNLKNFDFFIFNCYGIVLPLKLISFTYEGLRGTQHSFAARFADSEELEWLQLEGSGDDGVFYPVSSQPVFASGEKTFPLLATAGPYKRYRLKILEKGGRAYYSPVVKVAQPPAAEPRPWPNPVTDRLFITVSAVQAGALSYTVLDPSGKALVRSSVVVPAGSSTVPVPTGSLEKGIYYLRLEGAALAHPLTVRFVK